MGKLENLKLKDLIDKSIDVKGLSKIRGGNEGDIMPLDGCRSGICSKKINPAYCDGGAVCTCGIAG